MPMWSLFRRALTFGQGVARGLPEAAAGRDPFDLFDEWFTDAQRAGLYLPEAMTLATSTPGGQPSARMVLLKGVAREGMVFFTNYESRKARELAVNGRAALVFHWGPLQRQVRVEGTTERLTEEASLAYFRTRPRGSRLGAWASKQSAVLGRRQELEARVREYEQRFAGSEVPLPPFWGGYRVAAHRMEFWQGRASRLHDRLCFVREADGWTSHWLYP
jgi:pyridoxamine 5'-phosphate oxidase